MHLLGDMEFGGSSKLVKFDLENSNKKEFIIKVCCLGIPGSYGNELTAKGYHVKSMGIKRSWLNIPKNITALFDLYFFLYLIMQLNDLVLNFA